MNGSNDGQVFEANTREGVRLEYRAPRLTIYGDVVRLTEHNVSNNMNDGGGGSPSKT